MLAVEFATAAEVLVLQALETHAVRAITCKVTGTSPLQCTGNCMTGTASETLIAVVILFFFSLEGLGRRCVLDSRLCSIGR